MINKFIRLMIKPTIVLLRLLDNFAFLFPDKLFLIIKFYLIMKKKINLKNPKTFNEKLQWLKLHDRKTEYTQMVDKIEAKKYVSTIIGEEYIIPNLGVYDKFEDIDFDKLPNQFVLKCTHDCGGLVICKDKSQFDIDTAERKLNKYLKRDYYFQSREWPYKKVKPRIIAEKYIIDSKSQDLLDYKFMVFNGKVKSVFVCSQRKLNSELKVDFFDENWKHLPFKRYYKNSETAIPKPKTFDEMKLISEKLARNIKASFVRIDFYEVNSQILFGEITFFPGGGWEYFSPEKWDYTFGDWINLQKTTE